MNVAIIAPPYPLEEAPSPPLGVTYVAAAFESAGTKVRIIDYIVSRYTEEKLKHELEQLSPRIVGATSVTMNFPIAASILETAKKLEPSAITVMGGPHVSFDAVNTLKRHPGIDMIVIGEGEDTIIDVVRTIESDGPWSSVRGIAYRDGDRIVMTEPRELIENLDRLPLPARHLLPLSRYQALGFPVSIITSRGCPNACIFCLGRRMVGKKVRHRDPSLVVDEIAHLLSFGFSRINIADDLFTANKKKVRDVCREIGRRGLTFSWSAFSRVNTVDVETLELMRDAGCDAVSFGIESGNPDMLKRIRKGITLDQARNAVALCKKVGILAHASFMVGLPGETTHTLQETGDFAESLDIEYGFHFLAPFPGTTVREKIDAFDLEILTDEWDRYDANSAIVRTSALSADEINEFVAFYEKAGKEAWERSVQGYYAGTNTPLENMSTEGQLRTQIVFRILSEDLVEECGRISPSEEMKAADALSLKIAGRTGCDQDLVTKTIKSFIEKGQIKKGSLEGSCRWYWTHNKRVDRLA